MNFSDLILHKTSRQQLDNYLRKPAHALLLTGENGVGLATIAESLAKEIAGPNVAKIEPTLHEKQKTRIINADDMRDLFKLTRAKRTDNFVIIIDDADQTADGVFERILKLLEEPIANVFYILTTHRPAHLPATILSRAQTIEVSPPPAEMCEEVFSCYLQFASKSVLPQEKHSMAKISKQVRDDNIAKPTAAELNQIKFLANRKPAEINRLLLDEEYFRERADRMNTAKNFVQGQAIDRLKIAAEIAAGKNARAAATDFAKNISQLLLLTMARNKNPKNAAKNLATISSVIDNLSQNGNVRAQLTHLAVNM